MLRLALFFLVVSLVAALFGFGGISAASADIARILFFIAIVIFVVLLVAGLMAGMYAVLDLSIRSRDGVAAKTHRGWQIVRCTVSICAGPREARIIGYEDAPRG